MVFARFLPRNEAFFDEFAAAARLARDGAVVTICGRTEDRLKAVADELSASGLRAAYVVADVTNEEDVHRVVDAAAGAAGNLKGVVANAGGGGGLGPYHLQNTAEYIRVLELNVVGTMLCIKHSVPHLVAAGGGSFVGMSSSAGAVTRSRTQTSSPAADPIQYSRSRCSPRRTAPEAARRTRSRSSGWRREAQKPSRYHSSAG